MIYEVEGPAKAFIITQKNINKDLTKSSKNILPIQVSRMPKKNKT